MPDLNLYYQAAHVVRLIDWSRHEGQKQWVSMEQQVARGPGQAQEKSHDWSNPEDLKEFVLKGEFSKASLTVMPSRGSAGLKSRGGSRRNGGGSETAEDCAFCGGTRFGHQRKGGQAFDILEGTPSSPLVELHATSE